MANQTFNVKGYKVKIRNIKTNSNYNKAVNIFKDDELISGFHWKNTKINEILPMVENSIERYENPKDEFLFLN
jgi:hypothetical protein